MRGVKGFDRPAVQWTFAALALALTALVASLSVAVWRLNGTAGELRAERLDERTQREQLEARLARERSTREALALELSRLRAGTAGASTAQGPPTLTLQPLRGREATPPEPTMAAPAPTQSIELRLVLPQGSDSKSAPFEIAVRDWVSGRVRLTRTGLQAVRIEGGHAVTAYVTGDVFAAGSHEVLLKNKHTEVATYEITVK